MSTPHTITKKNRIIGFVTIVFLLIIIVLLYLWMSKKSPETSLVHLVPITEEKTGSEVCYEADMSCISVTTTEVFDVNDKFFGFLTPSCDSQIIRTDRCIDGFDTEFAFDNIEYKRSPNADPEVLNLSSDLFCLAKEGREKGVYNYAYCVER